MGHGASSASKSKQKIPGDDYPVQPSYPIQPPAQPPANPPGYNEPLHVPVSFYPDNVYSTTTGTGVIAQMNRDLDNFDYQLTQTLDGNRYFNKVHDPTIPPAPGMVQILSYKTSPPMAFITSNPIPGPSTSNYVPQTSYMPPTYPQAPPPSYPGTQPQNYPEKVPEKH